MGGGNKIFCLCLGYSYRIHLIPMRNVHEIVFQNNAILQLINRPAYGLSSRIIKSNHCCPVKVSTIGLKSSSLVVFNCPGLIPNYSGGVNEPQLRIGALAQLNNHVFSQIFQYLFMFLGFYQTLFKTNMKGGIAVT